jgi:cytochrome b involved in lipid metabolism
MARKVAFFTPEEIATHNCEEDIWVSFLDKVYDITPLAAKCKGTVMLVH